MSGYQENDDGGVEREVHPGKPKVVSMQDIKRSVLKVLLYPQMLVQCLIHPRGSKANMLKEF